MSKHSSRTNVSLAASSSVKEARAVSWKLSPEPDEELILSFLDKSVLLVVWTIAIIYSVMSPSIIRLTRNSTANDMIILTLQRR